MPIFFELPFQAAPGSEPLLRAIEIARAIEAGARGSLTLEDPSDFVPASWRPHLAENGAIDRRIWEMALAFATQSALRAGSLFVRAQGGGIRAGRNRQHVSEQPGRCGVGHERSPADLEVEPLRCDVVGEQRGQRR